MSSATVATAPTSPIDVAALLVEAFPRAIVRRLRYAGYESLGTRERAAARLKATVYEAPGSAGAEPLAPPVLELVPITPEIAARNREALEAELLRLTRDRRGGRYV
jgi:hypothetical protein